MIDLILGTTFDVMNNEQTLFQHLQVKGRHRWTIDNFLRRASCTEVGDSLCSPVFSVPVEAYVGEVQDLAFQLEVFPNGEEGEDNR